MQTPTTTMRVPRGDVAMIWSSTPGTPTHSKTTAGRTAGPGSQGGSAGARPGSRQTAASRQLCQGVVAAGSTTTSAPSAAASSRRRREKSAATIGRTSRKRNAAITASPTGPQPITSGASSGVRRALFTACRPTAIGSVSAACSVESPAGTGTRRLSVSRTYSP